MPVAIDDLADILEKQIRNYEDLKDLALEKRKAIITNDLRQLADFTMQIEIMIASNSELEARRISLAKKAAAEMGVREAAPTLARIAECFDGDEREKLLELKQRASSAIQDLQRQNHINAEMLKYSAQLIDSVIRRLVEDGSCEPTYRSDGKAGERISSNSLLDREV